MTDQNLRPGDEGYWRELAQRRRAEELEELARQWHSLALELAESVRLRSLEPHDAWLLELVDSRHRAWPL